MKVLDGISPCFRFRFQPNNVGRREPHCPKTIGLPNCSKGMEQRGFLERCSELLIILRTARTDLVSRGCKVHEPDGATGASQRISAPWGMRAVEDAVLFPLPQSDEVAEKACTPRAQFVVTVRCGCTSTVS
ncbi:hypothetical protein HYQ44_016576 [Verticillium longisporum]|nr:hypothetical protein HYQ44_016576 [Verticillium longisporum]